MAHFDRHACEDCLRLWTLCNHLYSDSIRCGKACSTVVRTDSIRQSPPFTADTERHKRGHCTGYACVNCMSGDLPSGRRSYALIRCVGVCALLARCTRSCIQFACKYHTLFVHITSFLHVLRWYGAGQGDKVSRGVWCTGFGRPDLLLPSLFTGSSLIRFLVNGVFCLPLRVYLWARY